jgi:hypothetical protein
MDSLDSDAPSALALDQLCSGALHELRMRGYSRRTVNRYTLVWEMVTSRSPGRRLEAGG